MQMSDVTRIHKGKQPRRPHFIQEWAELRGYAKQSELAEELGVEKSVVSRWYSGTSPGAEYQEKLAALFHCEPEALFRHPDDDWIARLLQGRDKEEREKLKTAIQAIVDAMPKRAANG